jgi:hypothetical protein
VQELLQNIKRCYKYILSEFKRALRKIRKNRGKNPIRRQERFTNNKLKHLNATRRKIKTLQREVRINHEVGKCHFKSSRYIACAIVCQISNHPTLSNNPKVPWGNIKSTPNPRRISYQICEIWLQEANKWSVDSYSTQHRTQVEALILNWRLVARNYDELTTYIEEVAK